MAEVLLRDSEGYVAPTVSFVSSAALYNLRRLTNGVSAVNRDDFVSRWRNTNLSREDVLAQVIG